MANNTKEILSSIQENTQKIYDDRRSFGPKLPSPEENKTENSVDDILSVLCGSFAQIILGKNGVDKLDNFKDVRNATTNTIFTHVSSIASVLTKNDEVKKFGKSFATGFIENNKIKTLIESLKNNNNDSQTGELKLSGDSKSVKELIRLIYALNNVDDFEASNVDKNIKYLKELTSQKGYINSILKNIEKIKSYDIESFIKTINGTRDLWNVINDSFKKLPSLITVFSAYVKTGISIGALKNIKKVLEIIKDLPTVRKTSIIQIGMAVEACQELARLGKNFKKLNKVGSLLNDDPEKNGLPKLVNTIVTSINKFNDIEVDEKKLQIVQKSFSSFFTLVTGSAMLLLFAGIVMTFINVGDLLSFTFSLSIFIASILSVYSVNAKDLEKSFNSAQALGELVALSGYTLILGSLVMKYINIGDLVTFIVAELTFVGGLLYLYTEITNEKILNESMNGLYGFSELVIASGSILILGSLLFKFVKFKDLTSFVIGMWAFMWTMSQVLIKIKDPVKEAGESLKGFGILILSAGATMLFGSMLYHYINWGTLFGFSVTLTLFMFGMTSSLMLLKKPVQIAEHTGKEFSKIMVMAAGIMLFGGLFFKLFPEIIPGTVQFTLIFTGFIFGVSKALSSFNTKDKNENFKKSALTFAFVVAIAGGTLLIAGLLMSKHPSMAKNVFYFTVCLGGLIWGMARIMKKLDKHEGSFKKGILALGVIVGCLILSTIAIKKLAEASNLINGAGGMVKFLLITGTMISVLNIVSIGILGLSKLLGNPAAKVAIYLTIGIILAAASALWVVSDSILRISKAMKSISEIKVIDSKALLSNLSVIVDIVKSLLPLTVISGKIFKISISMMFMSKMLSSIAESVKDYASLTVPIYLGNKKVGVRKLEENDFREAGKNVSLIISTLGDAIIKTYDKKPEIFETNLFGRSKFSIVTRSLKNLGPLISSIAHAVRQYASLLVPDVTGGYDNKHNRWNKYVQLNDNDFKNAAKNVSLIISTLGNAIIETYDKKPELFETNLFGRSKFTKVTKSLKSLGPMIAGIASAVQRYASLLVPETESGWNEKEKRWNSYRQLTDSDFQGASRNISLIISTLGQGIIDAYNEHPDYYDDGVFGGLFGNSPFVKTVKANMKLGKLISSIAHSVHMYANMLVPDFEKGAKWNEKEKRWSVYRQLTDNDFKSASKNIQHILSTLGQAIIDTYNDNKEMYDPGFLRTETPFSRVVKSNERLGNLISSIAQGVYRLSTFAVPDKDATWDEKTKKWSKYKQLSDIDFKNAAINIRKILTILGGSIIETYNDNKKMYDESSGFLGIGAYRSPITIAIEANKELANIISSIGKSVMNMAAGKIEIDWDPKTGKAIKWEHLGEKHFTSASKHISDIISTLGKTIIDTYNEHPDWFEDGEDSVFAQSSIAIGTMGQMIGNIATGMQSYANLRFPIKYNEEGKPIEFENLDGGKIIEAKDHINQVITSLGQTIIDSYKKNPDWYDDGEESMFAQASKAIGSMGQMIGSLASGLQSYAELKFPDWSSVDPKTGMPTKFKSLEIDDFTNAASNIGTVIGLLGKTIMAIYNGKSVTLDVKGQKLTIDSIIESDIAHDMFALPSGGLLGVFTGKSGGDNKFTIVVNSLSQLGNLISTIAESIKNYAELKIPDSYNPDGSVKSYIPLDKADFANAAKNIGDIITTLGKAIINVYNEPGAKQMFDIPKNGFWGTPTGEPNPFVIVIQSAMKMGKAISIIGKGINDYANMKIVSSWNTDGTPASYESLTSTDLTTAKNQIEDIVLFLGRTIRRVYNRYSSIFKDNIAQNVATSIYTMGKAISSISQGIKDYAELRMPVYDEKGNILSTRKMTNTDFTEAGDHIKDIMTTVANSVYEISKDPIFVLFKPGLDTVISIYEKIGTVLPNLATGVKMFASMTVPEYKDGKIVDHKKITPADREEATKNIGSLLTTIGNSIINTVKNNEAIFGKYDGTSSILNDPKKSPAYALALTIGEIIKPIGELAKVLGYYSEGKFPLYTNDNSKFSLVKVNFNNVKTNIESLFDSLLDPLKTKLLKYDTEILGLNKKSKAIDVLKGLTPIVSTLGNIINEYSSIFQTIPDGINSTKITSIIGYISESINKLNKLSDKIIVDTALSSNVDFNDIINGKVLQENVKNYSNSVTAKVTLLVQNLSKFVDIIDYANNVDDKGYKKLQTGLSDIIGEINEITDNNNFNNTVNSLDNYVKIINKVNLMKVTQLRGLTESLNALASKIGNIDKFAEILSTQVAEVLDRLTNELKSAQKTIKDVDKLHEKRKKLISESVEKIQKIMDKKMTVEVTPGAPMGVENSFSMPSLSTPSMTNESSSFGNSNDIAEPTTSTIRPSFAASDNNNNDIRINNWNSLNQNEKTAKLEKFIGYITDSIKPDGTIDIKQLKNKIKNL